MKQIYFLALLFFSSLLSAQNVNIPDATFKAKLLSANSTNSIAANLFVANPSDMIYVKIDTNDDGEISFSEASQIQYLNVNSAVSPIINFTGLEAFVNLKAIILNGHNCPTLDLSSNTQLIGVNVQQGKITDLNITNLTNLKTLNFAQNKLENLDVSTNVNLEKITGHNNDLIAIDVTTLPALKVLDLVGSNLTSIDVTQNPLLESFSLRGSNLSQIDVTQNPLLLGLEISGNSISNIDVTQNLALRILFCGTTSISQIDLSQNLSLEEFACKSNQLTSLDLTQNIALRRIGISDSPLLTELDITQNVNLTRLSLRANGFSTVNVTQNPLLKILWVVSHNMSELDLSNNPLIEELNISENNFTDFNFQDVPLLEDLTCSSNQFTSVDLSQLFHLTKTFFDSNLLTDINVKNGKHINNYNFSNNPNLLYICADDWEIANLKHSSYLASVSINSYCDFTPGGNFNSTSGVFQYDLDGNGCDLLDQGLSFIPLQVSLNSNSTNSSVYSNSTGYYNFISSTVGNYTLTPMLQNPSYFAVSPTSIAVNNTTINNAVVTQNFCITYNGIHPDLEILLVSFTDARPGEDASYNIICRNIGNQTIPALIGLNFNDAILDFVNASIFPTNIVGGTLQWNVGTLMPFQKKNIIVKFNLNSPQETPAVNIDDILAFSTYVYTPDDDNLDDNTFAVNQIVTGSFDPNDITCLQGNFLPLSDIGSDLHYNIRFENTGTGLAKNIVVKNTINLLQYDIQSLRVLESSHPVAIKVTGNVAEFIFEGINLEPEVQGNVLYKIKTKAVLANNEVMNKAEIYFDYNFPIITNDELTVFSTLSNSDFSKDSSLQIYPNPVQDFLNIKSENTITSIQLFDSQGRLLTTKVANETFEVLDISKYSEGIYFVSVITSVGKQTQKIIKK